MVGFLNARPGYDKTPLFVTRRRQRRAMNLLVSGTAALSPHVTCARVQSGARKIRRNVQP